MPRLRRKQALTYSIRYDPRDLSRRLVVKADPATHRVEMTRTSADVIHSKRGATVGCTNSNCAVRSAASGAFPHPVYLAIFVKTSAYIVDKLDRNGQPAHVVWYKHNDAVSVELNDKVLSRRALLRQLDMRKTVVLSPPLVRAGIKNVYCEGTHPQAERNAQTPRRNAVPRGAMARAEKAGLLILQK